ncbi:hypothetical protein SAMN05192589_105172 [Paracidovorax valerianellae]|uniref:Uncharacterized protein n=1 Tax=Paracidovorax valerianellae TaxID=187868 RepID=A0A1G6TK62_9BURK|nr:hypothetical protein SAMN05192589_105172 [Paracidovorax valerianellae]
MRPLWALCGDMTAASFWRLFVLREGPQAKPLTVAGVQWLAPSLHRLTVHAISWAGQTPACQ